MAYTNIDDPSAHFQVKTYTGTSGIHDVTLDGNSDMQPDFVWFKNRTVGYSHSLFDSSRGVNKPLSSDLANAEGSITNGLTRFDPNGFRVTSSAAVNEDEIVCWNWHANSGTTASNSVGNITSTVQANTDAGFSIVTYTGNGSANQTIGHGLGAVPKMILFKNRSNAAYWYVYHVDTGNDTMTYLNLNNAAQSLSSQFSTPTTTTFNVSNENSTFSGYNTSGQTYVAYVFADVQAYSKFGKYVGNGSTDGNGPFVYTGFKPAWIMVKNASRAGYAWSIIDNKRDTFNEVDNGLEGNAAAAESSTSGDYGCDFLSNGFKVRAVNTGYLGGVSGDTMLYMAFAENPFVTSTGIPTTAR